jgi:hypothetical protein
MESRKGYRFSPSPDSAERVKKKQQRNPGLNVYRGRNDGRLWGSTDSFTESAFIKIFMHCFVMGFLK